MNIPSRFESLVNVAMGMLPKIEGSHAKHFSFILVNSKILAVGINHPFKTHPIAMKCGYRFDSIHSELAAVTQLRHKINFQKCRLVNIRLSSSSLKYGKPILRMSRPCILCIKWILLMNFKQIYYSTNEGFEKL